MEASPITARLMLALVTLCQQSVSSVVHVWRVFLFTILFASVSRAQSIPDTSWPVYGNDPGGMRFSTSSQIKAANLQQLHLAWTFHTHALDTDRPGLKDAAFEATPILLGHTLIFTSPFDVVFALDALTGQQQWSYDPHVIVPLIDGKHDTFVTSRGVALWTAADSSTKPCSSRVFVGTVDARLLALDAAAGAPCKGFGKAGFIDLKQGVDFQGFGGYSITSPPTVIGNIVIVGSSIGDNQQVDTESGVVRAFDAVSGRLLWSWNPLPFARSTTPRSGAGNVWSIISADPALGLVYLPTSSASPDYYGGLRLGDNRDADSIVALDAATGRRVWGFQIIHHNLWDYDIAAEPLLFTFRNQTPALAIATKMGQIFVLNRRTGQPLYPVTERPVPQTDVPGEISSPTQPLSSLPPLSPLTLPAEHPNGWHRNSQNTAFCREQIAKLRYDGIYTLPSERGSLLFPGNLGGVNWGGTAFDPSTGILYANVNRELFSMKLVRHNSPHFWWSEYIEPTIRDWPVWILLALGVLLVNIASRLKQNHRAAIQRPWLPSLRATFAAMAVALMAAVVCIFPRKIELPHFGHELSPQRGTPYLILRDPIVDHDNHPCVAPPWGALAALNLNTGHFNWQAPLGTDVPNARTGSLTFGGPIVTSTGLVFTAATDDQKLRAFSASNGVELWSTPLPASARATPMTYTLDGRQFLVVAAGGHSSDSLHRGDSLVAFSLNPVSR